MLHSLIVKDYMEASLVTFRPDQGVLAAIRKLVDMRASGAPVLDHTGDLVGYLSEKDCLKVAVGSSYHGEFGGNVSEYMTTGVVSVDMDTSILDVAKMFLSAPYKCYPVVTENRLVGQISRHDVLRAIDHITEKASFA